MRIHAVDAHSRGGKPSVVQATQGRPREATEHRNRVFFKWEKACRGVVTDERAQIENHFEQGDSNVPFGANTRV